MTGMKYETIQKQSFRALASGIELEDFLELCKILHVHSNFTKMSPDSTFQWLDESVPVSVSFCSPLQIFAVSDVQKKVNLTSMVFICT